MDTNKLKKFATEARNKLKAGIAAKIITLGFDKNGNVPDHMHPQLMQGGSLWNGRLETEGFYHQWQALYQRVQQKGIKEVYEEAAYIWFNRLVAIRILQKNSLIEPVLEYVDEARTPRIVDEARMGRMPQMQERQRLLLMELLDDDSKTTEQFAILVTAFCHDNPILFKCFGAMSDYTELLLPNDILTEGGFIDLLNHTEFITDEDFRSPELIGWLYQFYISERKDEVFAKKGKFDADEIPAATQIFTPNWIVKYMVQNTIGRIYLDNNPSAAFEFKPKWKYLVEPSEPTPKESIYKFKELTELLTGDLACGSGHILNECFDLFYDLYIYEGYSRREAIENIFFWNLRGVDLDTRAKQLATFALMLKACQKDTSFADAHILPHVLSMPSPIPQEKVGEYLQKFFRETPSRQQLTDLTAAFELMQDADSLGSIMKFDVAESTLLSIQQTLNYWRHEQFVPEYVEDILPAMELILTLTDKYAALVMNPPYMGSGNMNAILSDYVKQKYPEGKADLCTTFMMMQSMRAKQNGYFANIVPPSWMFLSTFEELRRSIIDNKTIHSLLHLSRGVFGADFGSVSTVIQNSISSQTKGTYFRLVERTFQEFDQKHLKLLFEKTLENNNFKYLFAEYTKDVNDIVYSEKGAKILYKCVDQKNFEKIPGSPIVYYISKELTDTFALDTLDMYSKPSKGMMPGGDFLRFMWEVSSNNVECKVRTHEQSALSDLKWYPYYKGGTFRRWYGNKEYVVDYQHDGERVKAGDRNPTIYFKDNINWSKISSSLFSARTGEEGSLYDDAACQCFIYSESDYHYILGVLNSKFAQKILWCKSQTFNYISSEVSKIPVVINPSCKEEIVSAVLSTIEHGWESNDGYLPYQDVDRNIDIEAVSRLKHDIFDAGWSMYTSNRSQHIRYFLFCGKHNKLRRLLHSFIIWLVVK